MSNRYNKLIGEVSSNKARMKELIRDLKSNSVLMLVQRISIKVNVKVESAFGTTL